jgi:hypothetical protein
MRMWSLAAEQGDDAQPPKVLKHVVRPVSVPYTTGTITAKKN